MRTNLSVMKDPQDLIKEFKSIKNQIKILENHADVIKKQLVDHHFLNTDTLYCPHGLTIATYKQSIRVQFKNIKFQADYPELYDKYLDLKSVYTLLIK